MKKRVNLIVVVVLLAFTSAALTLFLGLLIAKAAQAATCNVPSGTYTTIQSAVNDINCDTINLTAADYVENVTIDRSVTILGQGADGTTVDGNASGSVFEIQSGLLVTFTDMTITNGEADTGGGIYNNGSILVLDEVMVIGNSATVNLEEKGGGGIYNDIGEVRVNNSVISDNSARRIGGGIYSDNGEVRVSNSVISGNSAYVGGGMHNGNKLTVVNSTFNGNSAEDDGGGIFNGNFESTGIAAATVSNSSFSSNSASSGGGIFSYGAMTITYSTFNDNSASSGGGIISYGAMTITYSTFSRNSGSGGAIFSWGEINITNSTFSGNSSSSDSGAISSRGATNIANSTFNGNSSAYYSGGISKGGGTLVISNSIIANSKSGGDCDGDFTSLGYNLDSDDSCNLTATGDIPNTNPHLGPLEGSPGYHPLLIGSRAINGGNPAGCTDHLGNLLTTDQPGQPRVGRCDIGAYEYQGIVHATSIPVVLRDFCPDFFDDFSNPVSGWSVVDDDFVLSEYLNGEYRILSRQSGFFNLFRSPSCDRESYVVEANARWVGPPGVSYGLIFGIADGFSNFYLFDINTDFREFRLLRAYPDGLATIVPITFSPAILGGNASNHLKVTRNGAQIALAINGTDLGTWSDGNITGLTGAGLVAAPYNDDPTSDARFDNFSLITLPGSGAFEGGFGSVNARSHADTSRETHIAAPIGAAWSSRRD